MKYKYTSRKFIDLIQGSTSKWANWDPIRNIAVGDFGMIINNTGEFDWEGNIYSPHFQEQLKSSDYKFDIDLADPTLRPCEQEARDDYHIAKSWGVTATKTNVSPEAGVQSGETVLKLDLQFASNKPEAVLVMYKPKYSSLPNDERIIRLIKSVPNILRGKYIITEVTSCAAYMMHMHDQSKSGMCKSTFCAVHISHVETEKFSVTLRATGPLAVDFTWSSEAAYGLFRQGCDPTATYMPLYRLKRPRPKFWELPFGYR
ncbi:hypothetical protein EDB19DRAFT_1641684 [Suillus lakei]|nr:hypothetical protein EDB19DRAFT_1641684 [Suillus lakei]